MDTQAKKEKKKQDGILWKFSNRHKVESFGKTRFVEHGESLAADKLGKLGYQVTENLITIYNLTYHLVLSNIKDFIKIRPKSPPSESRDVAQHIIEMYSFGYDLTSENLCDPKKLHGELVQALGDGLEVIILFHLVSQITLGDEMTFHNRAIGNFSLNILKPTMIINRRMSFSVLQETTRFCNNLSSCQRTPSYYYDSQG